MVDVRDPYVIERIRRAISEDPRVSEPSLRVFGAAGRIWLEGFVGSDERRRAVQELVEELAPGVEVRNELQVIPIDGPSVESVER